MSSNAISDACAFTEKLEADGTLVRFVPPSRGSEKPLRRISLTVDIHRWLQPDGKSSAMKSACRSHLAQFARGEQIDDKEFIKRVEKRLPNALPSFTDEVWSLRPLFIPGYRIFGAFIVPDWLVLLNKRERKLLEGHDLRWNAEIDKTCRIWSVLFPEFARLSGRCFHNYVTFNATHRDTRWEET